MLKKKIIKNKIILIGNKNLLLRQLRKLNYDFKLNEINKINEARRDIVNIINIEFKFKKIFDRITKKSNSYIEKSFNTALKILKYSNNQSILINGPISKKTYLNKKFLGITEYLASKTGIKDEIMLIYNEKFSVSPITTHLPIKYVTNKINKDKIIKHLIKINNFYKKIFNKKIYTAILGLNPHCETIDKFSEEEKIIKPAITFLKNKGLKVSGPYSADTFFIKKILKNTMLLLVCTTIKF